MALPAYLVAVNYAAWFVFMFISVVWILVMLQNRGRSPKLRRFKRLPKVSVLIPAYNEEKTIRQTIESIISMEYPPSLLDVIVINDCSTDRTAEIARGFARQGKITLLSNRRNMGKARSLNRALGICKGEFIACVDADSIVEKDIIRKLLPYFYSRSVAAVTPALKVWKKENCLEKVQHAEYILNVFLRKMLSFLDAIHVTPGVFSIYRSSVLKEVGGFDEENLTEDMEIALRIHEAGYSIESNLDAVSYTMCPRRWHDLYRQRLRWYRGSIENMGKYRRMFFNTFYGNLGMFLLPMNAIGVTAILAILFSVVYSNLNEAANFVWRLSLINFDFFTLVGKLDLQLMLEQILSTPFIFGCVGMGLGAYLLWVSFRSVGTSVRSNTSGYFLYLTLFPFLMMLSGFRPFSTSWHASRRNGRGLRFI